MTNAVAGQAGNLATQEDALPHGGLRLLGTMGSASAPEALLLLGSDVLRVTPGDTAGTARILAIEPGRVIVEHRGAARALAMPGQEEAG
ncbi:MAG: hypothetical protein AAFM92_06325 [Pseudomonadota bacterium]